MGLLTFTLLNSPCLIPFFSTSLLHWSWSFLNRVTLFEVLISSLLFFSIFSPYSTVYHFNVCTFCVSQSISCCIALVDISWVRVSVVRLIMPMIYANLSIFISVPAYPSPTYFGFMRAFCRLCEGSCPYAGGPPQ